MTPGMLDSLTYEQWREIMDRNLMGKVRGVSGDDVYKMFAGMSLWADGKNQRRSATSRRSWCRTKTLS
jgi:hypothetical protein